MVARLILARHGNTFAPQDTPVWVGARSDLPLVDKGRAQALALGQALEKTACLPVKIIVGSLQRTRQTAAIIAEALSLPTNIVSIDNRLTEIDYGLWEGKSTAEIEALGGGTELAAWNQQNIFPTAPNWYPSESKIIADTNALLSEIQDGVSLIVSSNGILRFFARNTVNSVDFPDRKVSTGHLCVMERDASGAWRIRVWNASPETFSFSGVL